MNLYNTLPVDNNMSEMDRWVSILTGSLLTLHSLRGREVKPAALLIGAELMRRGMTGHCYLYSSLRIGTADQRQQSNGKSFAVSHAIHGRAAVTVMKPRQEVFQFWRHFDNLPRVLRHVQSVDASKYPKLTWKAEAFGGVPVEWDAEVNNEIPNELIAWRTLPGAAFASAGSVHFKDAPGGRGTEVSIHLQYDFPAGVVGDSLAKLFGRDPETELESGLIRMKQLLETSEMATTHGQPKGNSNSQKHGASI